MTKPDPPSDPQRLCLAANVDIACEVAKQASVKRGTVLIWATEAADSGRVGLFVPRVHKAEEGAPADLVCILGGYHNGERLDRTAIEELNRRLTWTDAKRKRNRYKSSPATDSKKPTPGES